LVSTTFRNHSKEIKDNVSKNNALLRRLTAKGKIRIEDGGLSIVAPLDYAANGTYQRYSGFDVLNVAASDVISARNSRGSRSRSTSWPRASSCATTPASSASSTWPRRG
jgi:hypothetical protein